MGTRLKVMKLEILLYLNENYIPDPDRGFLSPECSVVCITVLRASYKNVRELLFAVLVLGGVLLHRPSTLEVL
jgi:hypothetical protein